MPYGYKYRFAKYLAPKIVYPLVPAGICFALRLIFKFGTYVTVVEPVIIFTIILPLMYLNEHAYDEGTKKRKTKREKTEKGIIKNIPPEYLSGASSVCVVLYILFMFSHYLEIFNSRLPYLTAIALMIAAVEIFITIKEELNRARGFKDE